MARIPRRRLGPGVFHVINRGIDRRWIFKTDVDKRFFVDEFVRQRKHYELNIYHWVMMSNHFHLAVETLKDVRVPWDYEWSSAKSYVTKSPDPLIVITDHPFWTARGSTNETRCRAYGRYLQTDQEAYGDEKVFRGRSSIVGDNDFKSKIINVMGRLIARKPGRPRRDPTE